MPQPDRDWFATDPVALAPLLLGAVIAHDGLGGRVAIRITETEAYRGSDDPGAHSFRGRTARNATMFGEAGHLYCYFTYGMHHALNVVAGEVGEGYGVLLRAGSVIDGEPIARARREARPRVGRLTELARGPGNLAQCFGATLADNGADLLAPPWSIRIGRPLPHTTGLRVGVRGDGAHFPWRFWLPGEPSVSAYRPAAPLRRP